MHSDHTIDFPTYLLTAAVIGITGGATWIMLVWLADFPNFWGLIPMVRLTTVCALIGGLFFAPFFGRDGAGGMAWAFLGAVLATFVGSSLAVGAVEDPQSALWGPVMVFGAGIAHPGVGGVWLLGMMAAHLVAAPAVSPENSDCP